MTGEVENILRGSVVTTVEYDTSRRLIGVSTSNLIPGTNGIAPLAKQGAFQMPEKTEVIETVDFVQAITNAQSGEETIAEKIDLPMLDQQPTLKEPVHSDVITENPVHVEDPSAMTSFELPAIEIQKSEPVVEETPVAADIEMPEMAAAVVADEPTELNEQLFEGATPVPATSILEEAVTPAVAEEPVVQNVETANEVEQVAETQMDIQAPVDVTPTIDIQLPIIEEKNNDIMNSIPSTTPDTTIPTFNIEMPVINAPGTENTEVEETIVEEMIEEVPVAETVNDVVPENQTTQEPEIVENTTPEAVETVEEAVSVTPEVPVEETVAEEEKVEEAQAEVVVEQKEEPVVELPQEVVETAEPEQKNENNVEGIKDIIYQHRVIIENCANAIAKIAEELSKAAKSLEELETKTIEMNTTKEETTAKVEEIVQQGNSLVNEAFDRINAMSAPRM